MSVEAIIDELYETDMSPDAIKKVIEKYVPQNDATKAHIEASEAHVAQMKKAADFTDKMAELVSLFIDGQAENGARQYKWSQLSMLNMKVMMVLLSIETALVAFIVWKLV